MKTLILELPGLLDARHAKDMFHPIEALQLPLLTQILSKADWLCGSDFKGVMLPTLEAEGKINPRWAVDYLKLVDDAKHYKYWFRADPVELQTDINAVYLKGNRHIELSDKGIKKTKTHLQDCFVTEDTAFFMVSEQEAYIGCNQNNRVEFPSPLATLGKNQLNSLPTGEDAPFWNKLLSEAQMSLFGSAAPSTEVSEIAPINSVCFWGDSTASLPTLSVDRLISNSNLLLGVGTARNIPVTTLVDLSMDEIFTFFEDDNTIQIVDMELLWLQKQGLAFTWQEKVNSLEQIWLPKIIQVLQQKQIDELWIIASGKNCFRLRPSYFKKFWKRTKTINNFLQ